MLTTSSMAKCIARLVGCSRVEAVKQTGNTSDAPRSGKFSINRTFSKKITFLARKFQKFCVRFLTLYAFIISKVIIRTQNYTNESLISAPVVISYQNL